LEQSQPEEAVEIITILINNGQRSYCQICQKLLQNVVLF